MSIFTSRREGAGDIRAQLDVHKLYKQMFKNTETASGSAASRENKQKHLPPLLLWYSALPLLTAFRLLSFGFEPIGRRYEKLQYQMVTLCVCANAFDFEM